MTLHFQSMYIFLKLFKDLRKIYDTFFSVKHVLKNQFGVKLQIVQEAGKWKY